MRLTIPRWTAIFVLVCASVLPFAVSLQGDFVWDDASLVSHNPHIGKPDYWVHILKSDFLESEVTDRSANRSIYRPFVSLMLGIEFLAFGQHPAGYHLVNLLLHTSCVLLCFFWLQRRLRGRGEQTALISSLLGAMLFAVHPARAESVAWISGCTDLWMTLWVLLGLTIRDRSRSLAAAVGTGLCFAIALLCKEIAVIAPVALLADDWLRGTAPARRSARAVTLGIPVGVLVLRLLLVPIGGAASLSGGALDGVIRVVATLGGYVRIVLWPWPASTQVGYLASAVGLAPAFPPASIVVGCLTVLVLIALCAVGLRQPGLRPWLADAVWFVLPLAPVLNVLPVSSVFYVAERHLYLAGLGLAALVARSLQALARVQLASMIAPGATFVLAGAYALGAEAHAAHFLSEDALWTYEAQRRPDDWSALWGLYLTRMEQGRGQEARDLAARMMALVPRPQDKAFALLHWLDADALRTAGADEATLTSVRREFDAIAARESQAGECSALLSTIDEQGRRWLRNLPAFHLSRARAAIAAGDFASAVRQLRALEHDRGPNVGDLRELVVALVASGDAAGAAQRLESTPQAPNALQLRQLVESVQSAGPDRDVVLAQALFDAHDWSAALAVERQALLTAPQSIPLVDLEFQTEAALRQFDQARAVLARMKASDPGHAAALESLLQIVTAHAQTR